MSDGPYRVEQDLGTAIVVDGAGMVLDRFNWTEVGRVKAHSLADHLNAVHRAASEKAAKVVEAAREAEKRLRRSHHICDDSWYSCPASGECMNERAGKECWCGADKDNAMADKLAQALADYDRD